MIRDFELWAPALLVTVVALSTLPFGSVGFVESHLLFVAVGLSSALVLVRSPSSGLGPGAGAAVAGLSTVAFFAVLQSLRTLCLGVPGEAESSPWLQLPGSVAPDVTRTSALPWLACAVVLAAGAHLGRFARGRRIVVCGVASAALFQALYGGQRWAGGSSRIWGREVPGDADRFRGTFVNPDHLAFYLGLALPLLLAWAWWAWRRTLRGSPRRLRPIALAPVLLWVMLFLALALTGSRAGLLTAVVVLAVQALVVARLEGRWRAGLLVAAIAGLGLAAIWWLSLEGQALGRLLGTSRYELQWNQRLEAYGGAVELWLSAPLFGLGLGTFRQAFPRVQPEELPGAWWHAHSDLLELVVTSGVAGAVIVALALAATLRTVLRGLEARRSEDRAAALAVVGVITAALLHSAVDFSLSLPANALTLALLVGCGCAVGGGELKRSSAPSE